MSTVQDHSDAISDAIERAVKSGRFSYQSIADASSLPNRTIRNVARRITCPRSDTLTWIEFGLKTLGIEIASSIVSTDRERQDGVNIG